MVSPEEWYFEEIDGCTYIKSSSDDSIVAAEYRKCYHCYDTIKDDRREYNDFLDRVTF